VRPRAHSLLPAAMGLGKGNFVFVKSES